MRHSAIKPGSAEATVLVRNTGLNLLGVTLPLLVGIIVLPLAIRGLGKEAFGVLSITWVVLGYFGLFDFGLSRATTKYVAEVLGSDSQEQLRPIVGTAVAVSFGLGLIGSLALAILAPQLVRSVLKIPPALIRQSELSFLYLSFSLPLVLVSTTLRGTLEAAQRFDLVNLVLIPASVALFVVPGLALPFHLSLSTVILLTVLSRTAAAGAYVVLCQKVFPSLKRWPSINWATLKRMLAFGGWVSVTNIVSPLLVYLDRVVIGSMISMTSVAYYSAPYEVLIRLRIFPAAIMATLFPEFSASSKQAASDRIERLFARALKYVFVAIGILALLLVAYAPLLLRRWLGADFAVASLGVFRILAVGVLINSLAFIPFNLLQAVGRPNLPATFHLVELPLYLLMLWFLTLRFGIDGAAWAWTLRVSFDALLLFGAAWSLFPGLPAAVRHNRLGASLGALILTGALVVIPALIFREPLTIAIALIVLSPVVLVVTWRYVLDEVDRQTAAGVYRRLRLRG